MKRTIAAALLICSVPVSGADPASDDDFIQSIMALSKTAGLCGAFRQMAEFQNSTEMAGGTEFVERFVRAESARLGHTAEDMLQKCAVTIASYDALYSAAGPETP